jgi:type 1 glutamine amidotransferase
MLALVLESGTISMGVSVDKNALIVWGGWEGHHPKEIAAVFERLLYAEGFGVSVSDSLDTFMHETATSGVDLIVPVWTMGKISSEQVKPLIEAVEAGVGLAGCHGGMCDSFRDSADYQFMTGGQWVAHPGNDGVEYTVRITDHDHPITSGLPDYAVRSEQYYMHTDPSNHVLAVTRFPTADGPHVPNGAFDMPVAWTRLHGKGRVFYHSVGHTPEALQQGETLEMCRRGMLWAAGVLD